MTEHCCYVPCPTCSSSDSVLVLLHSPVVHLHACQPHHSLLTTLPLPPAAMSPSTPSPAPPSPAGWPAGSWTLQRSRAPTAARGEAGWQATLVAAQG